MATPPIPTKSVRSALKDTRGGPNCKGKRYKTGLPFYNEYVDRILRPRVLALVSLHTTKGDGPPRSIAEFCKRFKETYGESLSLAKGADVLHICGLRFARQTCLISSKVLRNHQTAMDQPANLQVPQTGMPEAPVGLGGLEDELAGPTFIPPALSDPPVRFDNE